MAERKPISKKIRFEIFKRDLFTCQYCGGKAPEVVLEIDHIIPVAKNGNNEYTNLVTSCFDCNRGKSDKTLNDNTVIEKQRIQLENDQERLNQIEMIAQWRIDLKNHKDLILEKLTAYYQELTDGKYTLSESFIKRMRPYIKKYGVDLMYDTLDTIINQYGMESNGLSKFGTIIKSLYEIQENPIVEDVNHLCSKAKYKIRYMNFGDLKRNILKFIKDKYEFEEIETFLLGNTFEDTNSFVEKFKEYHNG